MELHWKGSVTNRADRDVAPILRRENLGIIWVFITKNVDPKKEYHNFNFMTKHFDYLNCFIATNFQPKLKKKSSKIYFSSKKYIVTTNFHHKLVFINFFSNHNIFLINFFFNQYFCVINIFFHNLYNLKNIFSSLTFFPPKKNVNTKIHL